MLDLMLRSANSFSDYAIAVNSAAAGFQDLDKEYVPEIDVVKACTYIEQMAIRQRGDALIYCAALNMLNTYVKQRGSLIGYMFKRDLDYLLSIVINADIEGMLFDLQVEKGATLLVVQVDCVQFSFHNIAHPEKIRRLSLKSDKFAHLDWDGIRKQKCAVSLFQWAIQNPFEVSNRTYRGKVLTDRVERAANNYLDGRSNFSELVKYARSERRERR